MEIKLRDPDSSVGKINCHQKREVREEYKRSYKLVQL